MNRLFAIILLSLSCIYLQAQNDLGGIGQWRGHFNNHSIKKVVKGDYVYAASPYQIIALDNKNPIHWIDKSTGLNDIDIEQIAWDENQEQLIISYAYIYIYFIKGFNVFNIYAIQITNLYPFRKINRIYVYTIF
jgi:hypothetical protein